MKKILQHQNSASLVAECKTDGWNWPAFLIGPFWYMIKGMWGKGFKYLLILFLVSWTGIGPIIMWFVMGAKFNKEYFEHLLLKGYTER